MPEGPAGAGRAPAPASRWARLTLALAGIGLTLGLLEVGVRLVAPQDLDYFNSMKIRRPSAKPGWTHELIPHGRNASYIGVPVAINSQGLRDRELAHPKPPGTLRVVAVGDSTTFGYGVRLEESFVKVLERRLNATAAPGRRYEVVNAGIEATDLGYYYAFVRSSAPALEPDLVLVSLTLNDVTRYDDIGAVPVRAGAPPAGPPRPTLVRRVNGALFHNSQLYLSSYMSLKSLLYRIGVLDVNRVHDYDFLALEPPSERQERAWRSTFALLARLLALTREQGHPLVLVVFPMEVQLTAERLRFYQRAFGTRLGPEVLAGEPQRRLREFGAAHDVPVIDLLAAFRARAGEPLYLRNRGITHDWVHPSPIGHRVAGEAIHQALAGSGLPRPRAPIPAAAAAGRPPRGR